MKHTEAPHELDKRETYQLMHGDKIIYAAVRRYMNKDTRECFPAIRTIAEILDCTPGKVQAALTRLVNAKFLDKINSETRKNSNHYKFPITDFDKEFEMFTDGFLDLDLPLNVKEYYMDIQNYLYGKETGKGRCTLSNAALSRKTGWTVASVKKYNTILIEKGFLTESATDKTDEAGFLVVQKEFDLQGLKQAELWARQVTAAVLKHEDEIQQLQEKVETLIQSDKAKDKEIAALKKQLALQNNYVKEVSDIDISKECK